MIVASVLAATVTRQIIIRNSNDPDNIPPSSAYYYTSFNATENPISEGSAWINGGSVGIDFQNVQTGSGRAYGIAESGGPPYDDSTAVLTGTWSGTQWASATAFVTNQGSSAGTQEIELRLLTTITANSLTGYEILFSVQPSDPYVQLVRWNGPLNDFTVIGTATLGAAPVTGDVMSFSVESGTFHVYKNGTEITLDDNTDSTYTTGYPGIGFWKKDAAAAMSDAGWSDFVASDGGLVVAASASQSAVSAAITAATTGDTVLIPPGASTWTAGVSVNKTIAVRGSGGGWVQGSSTTSRTPGTSPCNTSSTTCAFTLQAGSWFQDFQVGETVIANFKASATEKITGTVQSWNSGTGVLTLAVSAVTGSTARAGWVFSQDGATRITNNIAAGGDALTVTESTADNVVVSDLELLSGTGTGDLIELVSGGASGKPVFLHDLRFSMEQDGNNARAMHVTVNRGVAWHVSMDCRFNWYNAGAGSGGFSMCTDQGISVTVPGITHASWTTVSTMGMADTTGTANFYLEDSYCAGINQSASDFDDNSRVVWRYNVMDHCQLGSHGQETSAAGERHKEIYNNLFIFNDLSTYTANINAWFYDRGGTGVVADNTMPNITSSAWGNKPEVYFTLLGLQRNSASSGVGINGYACWGNGTSTYSSHGAKGPPYPRQHGYGYVTGSGVTDATLGYRGDFEPYYIWNNGSMASPSITDDDPINCDGTPDDPADYIHIGATAAACPTCEVLFSTDSSAAKAGYTKYTYPHPLRPD
jgi:hypothetical protein